MTDISADGGDGVEWLGTRYRTALTTADSGGAICVVDSWSPAGSGPPRHVHDAEDETFVVLEGTLDLWIEGTTRRLGPGEAGFIPRGSEHTFRCVTDNRHLVILTPGGFEGFFTEMAAGQFRVPEDMARVTESGARHNVRFTGPPL